MSGQNIRENFLAARAGIEARHAALLHPPPGERRMTIAIFAIAALVYVAGLVLLDISPLRILNGAWRLLDLFRLMWPPVTDTWAKARLYVGALGQTLAIAFVGTSLAAILAVPVGFLAARNVVANRILHLLTRRSLDVIRSVDTLIWALVWINVVGLGPFAGALAIMSSDFAAFGKLMSEAVETADRKPVEGVIAAGGGRLAAVRFGILPQVLPVFASQVLYFFESNVRSATIIGIVGAGGVGLWLSEAIRVLEWNDAAFIILLVLITVAAIDVVSRRLRAAIIGQRR
jgi:phosphonate transport system permease protein